MVNKESEKMDEYIKKQTAIDALAKAMPLSFTPDGSGEFDHDIQIADEAFVDAMQVIHDLPSEDVAPVRHGYWIVYVVSMLDGEDVKCSECGTCGCAPYWDYCPHCGARMDGAEDG